MDANITHITLPQALVDGFAVARRLLTTASDEKGRADVVLAFLREPAIVELIAFAHDEVVRAERREVWGVSPPEARDAIAGVLWTVYVSERRPLPQTPFDMLRHAQTVSANMVREAGRVKRLTGTDDVAVRKAEQLALVSLAWREHESACPVAQAGAEQAVLRLTLLLLSTPERLAQSYRRNCGVDSEIYLYLQDLETWFTRVMSDCIRGAVVEAGGARAGLAARSANRHAAFDPHDAREDGAGAYVDLHAHDRDEEDDDGGIAYGDADASPRPSGGGGLAALLTSDPLEPDPDRMTSLRELVSTATAVLSRERPVTLVAVIMMLVARVFAPRKHGEREALLLICREVARGVPTECDDSQLRRLIGPPAGRAARRDYGHARARFLECARDADQRSEWAVMLNWLLRPEPRTLPTDGGREPIGREQGLA